MTPLALLLVPSSSLTAKGDAFTNKAKGSIVKFSGKNLAQIFKEVWFKRAD
jgi:hypothetical protein